MDPSTYISRVTADVRVRALLHTLSFSGRKVFRMRGVRCMRMSFARYFEDDHDAYSGFQGRGVRLATRYESVFLLIS